jgi:uroporphyrinogen decarboxylase
MSMFSPFCCEVTPDFDGLLKCIRREGRPDRVHVIELFQDGQTKNTIAERYGIGADLDMSKPFAFLEREIAIQRFLGYDSVWIDLPNTYFDVKRHVTDDTADGGTQRAWSEEHGGPVQTWADFERYPWPDIRNADTSWYEWAEKNLPGDMRAYALTSHIIEMIAECLGYETLCYKVYEEPDLVDAVAQKVGEFYLDHTRLLCQFSCTGFIWGSDDMGFKTQTSLPPDLMRSLILPWHKKAAAIAHEHGKPYLLHACGQLESIMDDLIDDVKIDAKHSYEDVILPVTEAYDRWGGRIAILGGIDLDLLCRATEEEVRARTRATLEHCHPGGGYCLGTGNSVANYVPVDNYLAMIDEGRRFMC